MNKQPNIDRHTQKAVIYREKDPKDKKKVYPYRKQYLMKRI